MHLNCPECNTSISADGVNIAKTIAICKSCDNVFAFEEELTRPGELAVIPDVAPEAELPRRLKEEIYHIPPGIEVLKIESMLEIMVNWRRSGKYFTLFFGIMWNLMLGFFIITAFASGGIGSAGIFLALFMLPFIGVGGYLIYAGLGQIFNTTFVTVNNRYVSIEHKPLNFLIQKDKYFEREQVKQLYVRRYSIGSTNGQPVYAYTVQMELENNKTYSLVKNLRSLEAARFIEQEVENYMNIEDQAVRGEWKGDVLKKSKVDRR